MRTEERIARRIVASIYSWYTIEEGRAYAFLDKHAEPFCYVERRTGNSYRVVRFRSHAFSGTDGKGRLNAVLVGLKNGDDRMLKVFGEVPASVRDPVTVTVIDSPSARPETVYVSLVSGVPS